jgi:PAS domain S-box-containing protein
VPSRHLAAEPQVSQMQDAEETVLAIYQGAVDAVVVQGRNGPQIVTLAGADEPYRVLVERMSDGAMTVGPDGHLLYVNQRLVEMTGRAVEDLVGQPFVSLFSGDCPDNFRTWSPPPCGDGQEVQLSRCGESSIPVMVWAGPIALGEVAATLVTVTDRSIHRRAKEIADAERFARSILEQATDAIVVLDPEGRITHASHAAEQLAGLAPRGRRFSETFSLQPADPSHADVLRRSAENLDSLLATRPFHGIEVRLNGHERAKNRTFLLSAGPLLDPTEQSVGSIVTLTDITARKRAEEQQLLLVAELNHRVKNILAIVQSVAAQTVRTSPSLDAFKTNFGGRLRALAVAHDVLTKTRWGEVELTQLLADITAPYSERVGLEGEPLLVPAQAVVPISMVLHELMTNAAKYGSLSGSGRVSIAWSASHAVACGVRMIWQEEGGPLVAAGARAGFGTTLIERVVKYDLDGSATVDLRPDGLRCTLDFPVALDRPLSEEPPASAKALA